MLAQPTAPPPVLEAADAGWFGFLSRAAPLLAPVVGAIIGAFLYRKLIGRFLPCECGIDE